MINQIFVVGISESGQHIVARSPSYPGGGLVVHDLEHLSAFIQANPSVEFLCSSSLDFPEEFTKSEEVIKFAHEIRANGV